MQNKNIKFFDKNINRKSSISDKNLFFFKDSNIPMPSVIEVSNSGMCNRKCSFCPRSDPDYNHVNKFIDDKLHKKIYDELETYNYSGSIIYSKSLLLQLQSLYLSPLPQGQGKLAGNRSTIGRTLKQILRTLDLLQPH